MGNTNIVRLLYCASSNFHVKDKLGRTSLLYALEAGYADIVTLLLDAGAGNKSNAAERSLVSYAAEQGYAFVLNALNARNFSLSRSDNCNRTLLSYAAKNNHADVVARLLKAGVSTLTVDMQGKTARAWAESRKNEAVVEMISVQEAKQKKEQVRRAQLVVQKKPSKTILKIFEKFKI
jgi:uncharacterized protein